MQYSSAAHHQFLEDELRAQTEAFMVKLESKALYLLQNREELFVAQFVGFQEGELVLLFPNSRSLPRQGEYLYCFTVPKPLRDYRNWGNMTYGDLIKAKTNYSELVCIWQAAAQDKNYSIVGFRGVELAFAQYLQEAVGIILLLGPNKPPFEYIVNLQKQFDPPHLYENNILLNQDFSRHSIPSETFAQKRGAAEFVVNQLSLQNNIIIQGPPGTGKTQLIADICAQLIAQNKSVLVTALTNRALLEIALKPALNPLLESMKVFKTKITTDEAKTIPQLQTINTIQPMPGSLILATFYIVSGLVSQASASNAIFDYLIIDEASQALMAFLGLSFYIGHKNIWVGDTKQLSPIVMTNEDRIKQKGFEGLIFGLETFAENTSIPVYQLTDTYRLTQRAATYTSLFYKHPIVAVASSKPIRLVLNDLEEEIGKFFNPKGGPTLIKTEMEMGNLKPARAIQITSNIVEALIFSLEKMHITVLSFFVETTKALQKAIFQKVGYHKNLLIETVSKVQGLTTDITIYVIPNSGYHRSLEKKLFNVATSRSKRHTLMIADKDILQYFLLDEEVKAYLTKLENEFSFLV
ncbi:MAG TPA: hypothetical protein DCM08_01110 [Microscillaceae bacterium]|nr:hypothetical protein [Microscillaceae bacterium]